MGPVCHTLRCPWGPVPSLVLGLSGQWLVNGPSPFFVPSAVPIITWAQCDRMELGAP